LDDVETPEQLRSVLDQAEAAIDWAETTLDRLEADPEGVIRELSSAGSGLAEDATAADAKLFLKRVSRNAGKTIRRGGQVAGMVAQRQAVERKVVTDFEWAKTSASPEMAQARNILAQNPWLRRQPNGLLLAAVFVEGLKGYNARKAKPKLAAAATHRVAAQPGRPKAAPVRQTGKDSDYEEARQAWLKNPGDGDARRKMLSLAIR
jgi:hypothetical protein